MSLIKKKYIKIVLLVLLCSCKVDVMIARDLNKFLLFNEVMISNIDGYVCGGDFPDSWVEVFNSSNQDVDLSGCILYSNSRKNAYRVNEATSIQAFGYCVLSLCNLTKVSADKDFRLDTDGGYISLYTAENELLDSLTYPSMIEPEVGYGRISVKDSLWQWERNATPTGENKGKFTNIIVPKPKFSISGRVFVDKLDVSISIPTGDSLGVFQKVYYTLDGSEPTQKSAFFFSDTTIRIESSVVIRAKVISDSALTTRSVTQSYISHPRKTVLPIVSLATDSVFLYDDTLGIFSADTIIGLKPNYAQKWRRPINVEYLGNVGDESSFNQLAECGVFGASSRAMPQKGIKVILNKRFGTKHFKGQLWPIKPDLYENKSFLLRAGGNMGHSIRISDGFMQNLFGSHVDIDYMAYTPVIAYVNGSYSGVYGLRERSNEDNIWANYNGLENIEILETINSNLSSNYNEFLKLCKNNSSTFQQFANYIDVDEFCNEFCLQIFAANMDWPYNNVSLWRTKDNKSKWRFITKDIDMIAENWLVSNANNMNYYNFLTVNREDSTIDELFKKNSWVEKSMFVTKALLTNKDFSNLLVDKMVVYLGDFLKQSVTQPLLRLMREEILNELVFTRKLYYNDDSLELFNYNFYRVILFLSQRPMKVYQQTSDFYNLGYVIPMTTINNDLQVSINNIHLTEGNFDGACFLNKEVRLDSGSDNYGWLVHITKSDSSTIDTVFQERYIRMKMCEYLESKNEADSIISVIFETTMCENRSLSDFENKIVSLNIDSLALQEFSDSSIVCMQEPKIAYVNIYGEESLPSKKGDRKNCFIELYDNNGNHFIKRVIVDQQGNEDKNVYKQSFSITFSEDDWKGTETTEMVIGDWVPQDEFHLKAFYNDGLRGTAIVAYKLYDKIKGITTGAKMTGDAFPCVLYVNGAYKGLYAWQLKKHRKNYNFDKEDSNDVWLDGTLNDNQLFRDSINWSKFEVRNPKKLYTTDGSDYNGDTPKELLGYTSPAFSGKKKHVTCAEAKKHIEELSHYYSELLVIQNSVDINTESGFRVMREEINRRFDVSSLIDYMIFSLVTNNYTGFSKKWQWYTNDGGKWEVAPFDCELTFGYNEEGNTLWPAEQSSKKYDYKMQNVDTNGPMLWIKNYFWNDLCLRYKELRDSYVISSESIMEIVNSWKDRIGEEYSDEFKKYKDSPFKYTENSESVQRFEEWITERIKLEDDYLLTKTSTSTPLMNLHRVSLNPDSCLYRIDGRKESKIQSGINIIQYVNGRTDKVYVK